MIEYRADYIWRGNEHEYVALFRRLNDATPPEEYINGAWKTTEAAWDAYWDGDVGEHVYNHPEKIDEKTAKTLMGRWEVET